MKEKKGRERNTSVCVFSDCLSSFSIILNAFFLLTLPCEIGVCSVLVSWNKTKLASFCDSQVEHWMRGGVVSFCGFFRFWGFCYSIPWFTIIYRQLIEREKEYVCEIKIKNIIYNEREYYWHVIDEIMIGISECLYKENIWLCVDCPLFVYTLQCVI